jgi:transcriptional regulator
MRPDQEKTQMYIPPAFRDDDRSSLHATMRAARLCSLVTTSAEGLMTTPLPLLLDDAEGAHGVLHGHVARANPQWRSAPVGEAMAIFMGPDAYVTPSWYATKQETGKVVPTWNYVAVRLRPGRVLRGRAQAARRRQAADRSPRAAARRALDRG